MKTNKRELAYIVEVGFSYNPYDDGMTIYETYSKNKVLIDSVDDFKDALK